MANFLQKEYAGLPVWAWGVVALGGIGIGYFFIKKLNVSSSPTSDVQTASDVVANQPQGQGNQGFSTTELNGQQIPILPPGYQPITDGNGNVIGYGPMPPVSNPLQPPGGGPVPYQGTSFHIRNKTTSGDLFNYDKSHVGVPLHSGPNINSATLAQVPYGGTIISTGPAISGGSNHGSSFWYPVTYNGTAGYLSSIDIIGIGGGTDRTYNNNYMGITA